MQSLITHLNQTPQSSYKVFYSGRCVNVSIYACQQQRCAFPLLFILNILKEKNLVSRLISQSNNLDFDYTIFQVHLNYYYEVLTLTFKLPLNVNVVNQSFKVPLLRTSNSFFQLLTFDKLVSSPSDYIVAYLHWLLLQLKSTFSLLFFTTRQGRYVRHTSCISTTNQHFILA